MVLDSWAWMALVMGERAGAEVQRLLSNAASSSRAVSMTTVNLGEVWYSVARRKSPQAADAAVELVAFAGVQVVPADWALASQAARFKSKHRISYADGFAAALAHNLKVELVTGDLEFRELEGSIKIRWLSR